MRQAASSKPEVISAIRAAKRRLKRTPTRSEFERLSGIHWTKVQRLFGGYRVAVREAGLEPDPGGIRIDTAAMLVDFARVAREVGRHPTRDEYERLGRYASASLETRFQRWSAVRMKLLEFAEAGGLGWEWKDVVEKLKSGPVPRRGGGKNWLKGDRRHRTTSPTSCPNKPTLAGDPDIARDRKSEVYRGFTRMIADQNRKTIRHRWTQMSAGWNWGIKKIAVIARQRRHRTSSENHNQRQNPTLVM